MTLALADKHRGAWLRPEHLRAVVQFDPPASFDKVNDLVIAGVLMAAYVAAARRDSLPPNAEGCVRSNVFRTQDTGDVPIGRNRLPIAGRLFQATN